MSLFKRLRDLTLSNVYSLIEKAEDPVKMTDQYIRDMSNDLEDAEKAVAAQIALEKKFKKQYEDQEALVQKRNEQAHLAAQNGNVDLARRALEEKKASEAKRDEFKAAFDSNKAAADNLREKLSQMQKQLVELKNKRETLVARANAAKAQVNINRTMNGFSSDSAKAGCSAWRIKCCRWSLRRRPATCCTKRASRLMRSSRLWVKDKAVEDELAALLKQYEK